MNFVDSGPYIKMVIVFVLYKRQMTSSSFILPITHFFVCLASGSGLSCKRAQI